MNYNYAIQIYPSIDIGKQIIFPISMNQPQQSGQKLEVIINYLKDSGYQNYVTILICDYLNRHNCNEEETLKLGEQFLSQHEKILAGFKIIRHLNFIDIIGKEKYYSELKKIELLTNLDNKFYGKIQKTWSNLKNQGPFENSIAYQQEDCVLFLCMNDYDISIYPGKISPSLKYFSKIYNIKKPSWHQIKIQKNI